MPKTLGLALPKRQTSHHDCTHFLWLSLIMKDPMGSELKISVATVITSASGTILSPAKH